MGGSEKQAAKVLVVDDERHVREIIVRALKRMGYVAIGAANANEALFQLSQKGFDVALLDIRMPGMDGLQLLQKVKSDFPNTRPIMLTGMSEEETVLEARDSGAVKYLRKPCDLYRLQQALQETLGPRYYGNDRPAG